MPKKEWDDARPQGVVPLLSIGAASLGRPSFIRKEPASEAGFRRLRGKDSNLDYLIQSQASYH